MKSRGYGQSKPDASRLTKVDSRFILQPLQGIGIPFASPEDFYLVYMTVVRIQKAARLVSCGVVVAITTGCISSPILIGLVNIVESVIIDQTSNIKTLALYFQAVTVLPLSDIKLLGLRVQYIWAR
jgi:hypothetical protein